MVTSYRALEAVSFPRDEAAARRIRSGRGKERDFVSVEAGGLCSPPEAALRQLLADGALKEVKARG